MGKMHLEYQLVAHREINVLHQAVFKINRAESDMIDLRAGKSAILERAINKRYPDEVAGREIAAFKSALFKLLKIQGIAAVLDRSKFLLKRVGAHRCKNTLFPVDIL